ncbi:hypothetical protein [Polyangium jinanense]|uniref:Uncharacterized protein n=1 Tax=Polyangium jinanense TaxID=2829994 RepID=A0A9X3XC05_9BACT|nr:hypothetical protein [Polyangium jinanense]MDC3959586.1 hypothetical protein [Polyangium jinanense]MDC3986565.1 hypothetical protein [Polyangium jinanense]
MSTTIRPVRSDNPGGSSELSVEEQKERLRGENKVWHIGRTGRDDNDPMAGLNGSKVDLTRVLRGRRLRGDRQR